MPELPCAGCVHVPVCARKRAIDAIGDVAVRLPELEDGLALELRAVVTCDAYLKGKTVPKAPMQPVRDASGKRVVSEETRRRMSQAQLNRQAAHKAALGDLGRGAAS